MNTITAPTVTAALLIIGNEILSGRTHDANLPYVATALNEVGVRLWEVRVVPDLEEDIIMAIIDLRVKYDYVFTTGGIGPTHDDITSDCIARSFGLPLVEHPVALRRLQQHYADSGLELNEARRRMACVPEGAELIDNPMSAAPGFRVQNVFVLAGVPSIMQAMLDGIKPTLRGGAPILTRTVLCNLGEGDLATGLQAVQESFPAVEIGSYPRFSSGDYRVSLVLRHTDAEALEAATAAVCELVQGLGGVPRVDADETA